LQFDVHFARLLVQGQPCGADRHDLSKLRV